MLKLEQYIVNWPDFDFPNFTAWMQNGRDRWPNRIALRYRAGKNRQFDEWTYTRLFDEAEAFARALLAAGLEHNDRVAIWAENRPEWCAVWLGTVIAGCTIVPIDFLIPEQDVEGILAKAKVKALVLSERKAEHLDGFKSAVPSIRVSAVFDRDYRALIDGAPAKQRLPGADEFPADQTASIIFTSGTTGISKGVMLSHHGIIANFNASIQSLPIYEHDVFMCVLPLHHTYPTTCAFISPLSVGASITICEKVVGKVIIDDIRDSGGTIMIAVPLLYDKLKQGLEQGFKGKGPIVHTLIGALRAISRFCRAAFKSHKAGELLLGFVRRGAGLGSARLLVAGGGALDSRTADFFDDLGFNIVQGYGMSENGPLITTNTIKYKNNQSAGLPVKYTDIKIINIEEDGVGEIVVRSPSLMKGYFENAEATKAAFTEDGYLLTGDLGYVDQDGYLFITGRRKNLIVTAGGKNIYPEELEARFSGIPLIKELLVLPRKGEKGEEISAVFVPDAEYLAANYGEKARAAAFVEGLFRAEVEKANRNLISYQKITSFGLRVEEFEKTSSRKIKRFLYKDYDAAMKK